MRLFLLIVFFLSGFTGLVYESIWSHYLKLFLGHAAYAQTAVLALFMGGMAIGAGLTARRSRRIRDLLLAYALIEGAIGLLALAFHPTFVAVVDFSFATVIPQLGDPTLISIYKFGVAALLLLPQSILLGATFPLMSGGLARIAPERAGGTVAILYFTNSLGAAVGALISGFWLIEAVGLPGTIATAGAINLGILVLVASLARNRAMVPLPESPADTDPEAEAGGKALRRLFLIAAFVTGLASFFYEVSWIRLLSLVLGSTTHSFELMLAAFITGLAFGGLWVKRRIERGGDPVRWSGWVQVAMGVLAVGSLFPYQASFGWLAALLEATPKTDEGYLIFHLGSIGIAFAVMLPTTLCAGMTLPLFTHVLLSRRQGEQSIGEVYAANTLGAIVGVVLAIHLVLPILGVRHLVVVGALADILLGGALLLRTGRPQARTEGLLALLLGAGAIGLVNATVHLDPRISTSGVYRNPKLMRAAQGQESKVLYYRDGKTASVSVTLFGNVMHISTNGKVDASARIDRTVHGGGDDEETMVSLGALGLAYHPQAREAAVIGFGSGITTHTLLQWQGLTTVDTVEIEPAMVEGARLFHPHNAAAYADPRSHVHIDDARTFFAKFGKRYDLIVAEPSNPWVSGVSSLFTREFYHDIKRYLRPGGVLVQWIQIYEFQEDLLAAILMALREEFPHYRIYRAGLADLIVLAKADAPFGPPQWAPLVDSGVGALYRQIGLRIPADIEAQRIGDETFMTPFLRNFRDQPNSDFFPYLDLHAERARFLNHVVLAILDLPLARLPLLELLDRSRIPLREEGGYRLMERKRAQQIIGFLTHASTGPFDLLKEGDRRKLAALSPHEDDCPLGAIATRLGQLQWLAEQTLAFLPPEEQDSLWRLPWWGNCQGEGGEAIRQRIALYRAIGQRALPTMSDLAQARLSEPGPYSSKEDRQYALAVALLAELAAGHGPEAEQIWQRHGPNVYAGWILPTEILFLLAHLPP